MNALKPSTPFQILVMSEESRLGREQIETAYALKQLITADVRVFFYLEDRERTLNSPMEKAMLALQSMSDEMEREKARQRTYDALVQKARAGHVTGGRVFGYDNVDVMMTGRDGDQHRSHVERRINEAEAAIVRRIFELRAAGMGKTVIAKRLNDERAVTPRPQQGRPAPGRRRRCTRRCTATCTGASSCGTRPGSATHGARSGPRRAPSPIGCRSRRHTFRSFLTTYGRPCTAS